MTRPTPIEVLAREICWREFAGKKPPEGKIVYWAGCHEDRKADYMADAELLARIWGTAVSATELWNMIRRASNCQRMRRHKDAKP